MGDIKACNHTTLKLFDNFSMPEEAQRHQGLRIYLKLTLEEVWAHVNSSTTCMCFLDCHQTVINMGWGQDKTNLKSPKIILMYLF